MWQVYDYYGNKVLLLEDLYEAQLLAEVIKGSVEMKEG